MLKLAKNPYGFRDLLVYKKSEELQDNCSQLTHFLPHLKTLYSLSDQMNRSARSIKQNIVEGWKRNSTDEYYQFLGFSIGACAELEEDCNDIWKRRYPELMGIKGIMGTFSISSRSLSNSHSISFDIEKLKFYPLDLSLPPVVQLKLRCKEINFLLEKLQKSLKEKMGNEGTMTTADKFKLIKEQQKKEKQFEEELMRKYGKGFKRE